MKNRRWISPQMGLALALLFFNAACKIETDHTIRVKDETGKTDKEVDVGVDITVSSGYKPINTLAKIEPAVESDTAFFSNQEKIKNWSWNWYEEPLYPCASSTLANMPFENPHWYFAVGCQFTSFSCNEIGWYEQVHDDFFLLEITNVGGHIDAKNCLGAGTHLCEFKIKKGKNDASAFDYHCEKTDEELGI